MSQLDMNNVMRKALRYLSQGFAVALAAYFIPRHTLLPSEIIGIALSASIVFAVLDVLGSTKEGEGLLYQYSLTGVGIVIGLKLVGFL
jgi:hypothetical protein